MRGVFRSLGSAPEILGESPEIGKHLLPDHSVGVAVHVLEHADGGGGAQRHPAARGHLVWGRGVVAEKVVVRASQHVRARLVRHVHKGADLVHLRNERVCACVSVCSTHAPTLRTGGCSLLEGRARSTRAQVHHPGLFKY